MVRVPPTSAIFTANNQTGGPYTVSASIPGVATLARFSLTNLSGPLPVIVAVSGSPQSTPVNTAFAAPLVAAVTAGGKPVSGVTVTFAGPATGAGGVFAGGAAVESVITNAAGVATSAVLTANNALGPYTVSASAPGVAAAVGFHLTNMAGFGQTGSLNSIRYGHTATLLNNGMVLIAGGPFNKTAELFNPAVRTFIYTGSLNIVRSGHTATLLNNGMVLIVGGTGSASNALASAEIYNPETGTFTPTGSLKVARYSHSATLLSNGTVLIAGGADLSGTVLSSAELYNPATGIFSYTGSLNSARQNHTATAMNDGRVLIAGGYVPYFDPYTCPPTVVYTNYACPVVVSELYDAATGTFSKTGFLSRPDYGQTATLLNNGMVLLAGGDTPSEDQFGNVFPVSQGVAEVFDPKTGIFTPTVGVMNTSRDSHTATLLNNGQVLVCGGAFLSNIPPASIYVPLVTYETSIADCELFEPATGLFTPTASLSVPRDSHTATLLTSGMVLIAGGEDHPVQAPNVPANGLIPPSYLLIAETYETALLAPPNLVSISVTPSTAALFAGTTQRFIATGVFSDNSTQELTSVTWTSSNTAVAQISNDSTNRGSASAIKAGTVSITATAGTVSGSVTLTVKP